MGFAPTKNIRPIRRQWIFLGLSLVGTRRPMRKPSFPGGFAVAGSY